MKITLSKSQWQSIGKTAGWFSGDQTWGDAFAEAKAFIYKCKREGKIPTQEDVYNHLKSKNFNEDSIHSVTQSALNELQQLSQPVQTPNQVATKTTLL